MRQRHHLGILTVSCLLLFTFQNCGDIKVQQRELASTPPVVLAKALPQGAFCSGTGNKFGTPVYFNFIIDMSLSNLGGSINVGGDETGKSYWVLGRSRPATEPSPNVNDVTDLDYKRFEAVKNFISTCGNSSDFKYTIMGFSDDAILGSGTKTCSSLYEGSAEALKSVAALKQIQATTLAQDGTYAYASPFQMGDTAYGKGLGCLEKNIQASSGLTVRDGRQLPIYQTFFLTDGKPTDYQENATEQALNYTKVIQNIMDFAKASSSGVKISTIYYGPESEREKAKDLLDVIAGTTGKNVDGTENVTLKVDDFSTLATKMCNLYKPQATYAYRAYQVSAVNINRLQVDDHFEADSDADGISDKEELQLGFDPANPRTKGVLDILCKRAGFSSKNCTAPATCKKDYNGFALTDCDVQFASGYFGKTLTGYDTDLDQVVDFIEIIRGSNPAQADMQDDNDGDGVSNVRELINGTGLNTKDPVEESKHTRFVWSKSAEKNACANTSEENYLFNFTQVPITPGNSYTDKNADKIDFSHKADENVYLFLYLTEPQGTSSLPKRMNGVKITVSTATDPVVGASTPLGDLSK